MNTAIYSTSGQSSGVGFAVPVDTVKVVVDRIIKNGKLERPFTGLQLLGGNEARALFDVKRGLVVTAVVPGSGAAIAGFRPVVRSFLSTFTLGDVIIESNGKKVQTEADFLQSIDLNFPGDIIEVRVLRYRGSAGALRKPSDVTLKLPLQKHQGVSFRR